MTYVTKLKAVAGAGLIAGAMLVAAAPAQAGGVLNVPEADWTGGQVTCKVLQIILENEMGYKLRRITMPSGPTVREGMIAGDIDFACEMWPSYDPTKEKYVTEFGGDGSVILLGEAGIVGVSSYYVPRYLVEGEGALAPDLKTIFDLNKYVDLFKTLETGDKGRVLGCPTPAWECYDQDRMDQLGINFVAAELGAETAHWAEMQAAYARHEPFVAYAWEPHWIHAALDLVALELPPYDADKWPATGWPEDITYNFGRPGMLTEYPDAAQLIINSYLSNTQQAGMILAIDVEGRDMDEVVQEWIDANEATWRAWLP
jgi:ABC-type proline/glycine betaine transport system substrate-binding protein